MVKVNLCEAIPVSDDQTFTTDRWLEHVKKYTSHHLNVASHEDLQVRKDKASYNDESTSYKEIYHLKVLPWSQEILGSLFSPKIKTSYISAFTSD